MPYYRNLGWKEGDRPKSEEYYKSCISLPMFPSLSNDQLTYVIKLIKDFYS